MIKHVDGWTVTLLLPFKIECDHLYIKVCFWFKIAKLTQVMVFGNCLYIISNRVFSSLMVKMYVFQFSRKWWWSWMQYKQVKEKLLDSSVVVFKFWHGLWTKMELSKFNIERESCFGTWLAFREVSSNSFIEVRRGFSRHKPSFNLIREEFKKANSKKWIFTLIYASVDLKFRNRL